VETGAVSQRSLVACASTISAKKRCGRVAVDHNFNHAAPRRTTAGQAAWRLQPTSSAWSVGRHAVPFAIFSTSNRHWFFPSSVVLT